MRWLSRTRRAFSALFLIGTLVACATSKDFRAGQEAEKAGRHDEAVNYYSRAVAEDPTNQEFRQSLERAKVRSSAAHAELASKLRAAGDLRRAKDELELALALNPGDHELADRLEGVRLAIEQGAAAAAGATIEAMKRRAQERPLGRLELAPGAEAPSGFIFQDASSRDILMTLAKMAGVNILFDADFIDRPLTIELHDATFQEALTSVCRITGNTYVVDAEKVVTILPDTPQERRQHEQQATRTFYLSTADLKETIDLLRIVLGIRRIAPHSSTHALTIVDTPERIAAAERIITTVDRGRAEVVIELEILEVSRSRLDEYGIQFRSATTEGIQTSLMPSPTRLDQPLYRSSDVLVTGLPGAVLKLLRQDSDTRILANPRLRAVDGQVAKAEFGDRVPVPITTFTPIASGGVPQQPVTTFQYENIGVNVEIIPRIHHDDQITLELQVRLSAISGTGYGDLPTFGNRAVATVLRLNDGETNLLAGLIRDEERTSLNGIPGLADLPVLGRIFSGNKKEVKETDIVLTLTPRVVRRANLSLDDLRSFIIEGGAAGALLYETPEPIPRPDRDREKPQREEPLF